MIMFRERVKVWVEIIFIFFFFEKCSMCEKYNLLIKMEKFHSILPLIILMIQIIVIYGKSCGIIQIVIFILSDFFMFIHEYHTRFSLIALFFSKKWKEIALQFLTFNIIFNQSNRNIALNFIQNYFKSKSDNKLTLCLTNIMDNIYLAISV